MLIKEYKVQINTTIQKDVVFKTILIKACQLASSLTAMIHAIECFSIHPFRVWISVQKSARIWH